MAAKRPPDQRGARQPDSSLATGLVAAAHGRHYIVELADGSQRQCFTRGKKSDVAVGDSVEVQLQGQAEGVIQTIHPRRNLLYRSDEQRSKLFAANLDQLLFVIAGEPPFSAELLGRALVAAHSADITPIVLLNKADLPESLARAKAQLQALTGEAPPLTLEVSAKDADDLRLRLGPLLAQRRSLLLGQSGMGKSTLLNALVPGADAATQTHSVALDAGRHTTTHTRLYHLPENGGQLIDSPGFQNFGLAHLSVEQIAQGFPSFTPHIVGCRFYNCTHRHEPGCGVLAAVANGEVPTAQHKLYERMLQEKEAAQRY